MSRLRHVVLLLLSLLLLAGPLGGSADAADAGRDGGDPPTLPPDLATVISVALTSPEPPAIHVELTVTGSDGSVAPGTVQVDDAGDVRSATLVNGSATLDIGGYRKGEHTLSVDYLGLYTAQGNYLPSHTTSAITVAGRPSSTALEVLNAGRGVLELRAEVDGLTIADEADADEGSVVFEVAGLDPITVPMGRYVIPGRIDIPTALTSLTVVGIEGLDPTGTYQVTATYVPGTGSWSEGSTSSRQTITLDATVNDSAVYGKVTSPRASVARIEFLVRADHPADARGTVTITDLATKRKVATVANLTAYPQRPTTTVKTLRHVAPGQHRYRVSFVPASGLRGVLRGSSAVWSVRVR